MTNNNYGSSTTIKEQNYRKTKEREAIFILCDTCYWSATYLTQFMPSAQVSYPKPLGLWEDYKTLKKQDSDGFEIELRQSIEKYTKNKAANEFLKVRFHNLDGKEICEIIVSPGQKPRILR